MSEKTLLGLGAALVALLLVWGAVSLFSSFGKGKAEVGSEVTAVLAGVSKEAVTRVVLEGPSDTVTLVKADGGWTANGFEADSAALARLWSAVSDSKVRDLAAANPANHARLGVVPDSAWTLEFAAGEGEPSRLLLGKSGPGYNTAYVRLPGEDDVYTLEGPLRNAAAHDLEHWRDRTIVSVDTARVQRVEVDRAGERYVLTRDSTGWLVDGAPADGPTARSLVGGLERFEAQSFAPDTADFDAGEERRSLLALGEAGDTLAFLELSRTPESNYLARSPARKWLFEVPSWRVNRVTPERKELVASEGEGG